MHQIKHALLGEIAAQFAGFRVNRIKLGIGSGQENALIARACAISRSRCRLMSLRLHTGIIRHTSAGLVLALLIGAHFGVEHPALLAAVGIERHQPVVRGAQI